MVVCFTWRSSQRWSCVWSEWTHVQLEEQSRPLQGPELSADTVKKKYCKTQQQLGHRSKLTTLDFRFYFRKCFTKNYIFRKSGIGLLKIYQDQLTPFMLLHTWRLLEVEVKGIKWLTPLPPFGNWKQFCYVCFIMVVMTDLFHFLSSLKTMPSLY